MSNGDPFEQCGVMTVTFRNGQAEHVHNISRKEADVFLDHLGRMLLGEGTGARFAAVRKPASSYAVDLTQVRSLTFAPYDDDCDDDRWDRENREAREEFSKVRTDLPSRASAAEAVA